MVEMAMVVLDEKEREKFREKATSKQASPAEPEMLSRLVVLPKRTKGLFAAFPTTLVGSDQTPETQRSYRV